MVTATSHRSVQPLSRVLDQVASQHPDQTWISVPVTNNIDDGYRDVSFARLSRVVNKMSRWIEKNIGVSTSRETIAYMGVNDTRYVITILAALKTGYKILLTSTRNSIEGQRALLKATECRKFLHSSELHKQLVEIKKDGSQMESFQIPEFDDLLNQAEGGEHFEGNESNDPNEAAIIIHTSGSTGLPKPIPLRNAWLAAVSLMEDLKLPNGRMTMGHKLFDSRPIYCNLPWFHAMGLIMLVRSIYTQGPLVLPPGNLTSTAESAVQIINTAKPKHGFFPPSILEDMVDYPGGLEALGTMEDIYFAGAPLSHDVGDKISSLPNTHLQTIIGSTEAGLIDSYENEDRADWDYFEWAPHTGADMQAAGDGVNELVLKPLDNEMQGAFFTFPDASEWRTKDLYQEHPTKSGLWRYKGRNDDVIVLSNGEKFGPVDLEKTVEAHGFVKGALVVGQGRFQAGLLIEPDPRHIKDAENPDTFIDQIWPAIEKGNKTVAAHGRIFKSKVAITKPNKPFARAPKGSIMRRQTNIIYEKEIDAMYANESFAEQLAKLETNASEDQIRETVRQAIQLALPDVPKDIKDDDDLFRFGIDSLGVLGLTSAINHAMPQSDNVIKPRNIYSGPSTDGIVQTISALLHGDKQTKTVTREQRMSDMVKKYTSKLPETVTEAPRRDGHVVLLTGSTGSLGTYLLNQLIFNSEVHKVYCLNRSAEAEPRQKKSFIEKNMTPDFEKVEFLHASFGKESFGLESGKYESMLEKVDIIVHNAWQVDFNLSLESFEATHISGVSRCIEFSTAGRYHAQIVFVSSIASIGNWLGSGHEGFVPENTFEDDSVTLPQGYGESKHVSSQILAAAARKSGISATVVRVGQLAGPVTEQGVWNKQEWLPSIISSSKAIGKIPRNLGNVNTIDWVPVDVAAQVLLDLSFNTQADEKNSPDKLSVYHLVNPQTELWPQLVPTICDYFKRRGAELEVVDFADWVKTLKEVPVTKENAERVPGLKLLDFYDGLAAPQGLPRLATDKTTVASSTLRGLGPVNENMMKLWLEQWSF